MTLNLKKLVYIFWALSVGLLLAYLYFLNSSIMKLVEKKNEENVIKKLSGQLASLESDYMRMRAGLNMDLAKKLGFESVARVEFAPTKSVKDLVPNERSQGLSFRADVEI